MHCLKLFLIISLNNSTDGVWKNISVLHHHAAARTPRAAIEAGERTSADVDRPLRGIVQAEQELHLHGAVFNDED